MQIGLAAVLRKPCFRVRIPAPVPSFWYNWHMPWSKQQSAQYMKRLYDQQRAEFFEILGGCCAACGSKERLEIDHIDPSTKAFSVGAYWGKDSLPAALKELEKCQALCGKCHRTKSARESRERMLAGGYRHGSFYGWMKKKCQCVVCLDAKNKFNSNRRIARDPRRSYHPASHGSDTMYSYHGCRCDQCRAGKCARQKIWSAKKKLNATIPQLAEGRAQNA